VLAPVPVEWHGVAPSARLEALIQREALRLSVWYAGRLKIWKIAIEPPGGPRPRRSRTCARIEVRGPELQFIVNRAHEDTATALHHAFHEVFRKFDRRIARERRRRVSSTHMNGAMAA